MSAPPIGPDMEISATAPGIAAMIPTARTSAMKTKP